MKKFRLNKYIVSLVLALALSVTVTASPSKAAEASLLFGQKHAYTAVVRDDAKVVTYGKVFLTNPDTKPLRATSFTVPEGVTVTNLSVYQILLPKRCPDTAKMTKVENGSADTPTNSLPYDSPITCDRLEEQTFSFSEYGYYSYYSNEKSSDQLVYKKVDLKATDRKYSFTLPEPIKEGTRGAYLVSYIATDGYVSDTFGLYDLAFKTLQVPASIEEVRVAVDVAADFYTKAERSDIERGGATDAGLSEGAQSAEDGSMTNKSLDRLQSSIGSGGTFTKTGRALSPNESFVVNGQFADATWKLNFWWIVSIVGGLLVALLIAALLMKKAQKTHTKEGRRVK